MILEDNLGLLKSEFPNILSQLNLLDKELIMGALEETKNGQKTIAVSKNGKKNYLHSKYNPLREAETIVSSLEDIDDRSSVLFYGTGLGYHVELLLKKYPSLNYYLYEPVPELLYSFLSNVSIKKMNINRFKGIGTQIGDSTLETFIDRNRDNLKIVILPSHQQIFKEDFQTFEEDFLALLKSKKNSLYTNQSFQKRWVINSLKNFNETLQTPNIILEKKNSFKGKTAILVSAGPSLNEEIENLRKIKEEGLAYIFSVGSSINTLIHHGIYPDAACTYDPGVFNQNVFVTTKQNNIQNIPMIYGSSVGYETLEGYPGSKYHMITSQDSVASYFLKNESSEPINVISDAPSIAIVTLQLLSILGFSTIILVGQNLGYKGKERYSEGISYAEKLSEQELQAASWVKDVYGNEILTNETFIVMRKQMENLIAVISNSKIINTTAGGAHIEGTEFIELNKVLKTQLIEPIVDKNWLNNNKTMYDHDHLNRQIKRMDRAYKNALDLNEEYTAILGKIEKAIQTRNYKQAENHYIKLNTALRKIEKNDFYITFILPMNRVHYKVLVDSIDSLNLEKNPKLKGEKIIHRFRNFMTICKQDISMIETLYKEMKEQLTC